MSEKNGKPCKKCGGNDWYVNGGGCKSCTLDRKRKWNAANADKERERGRKRLGQASRERSRRWRAENPEKKRDSAEKWRINNLDKSRATAAKWKSANRDKKKDSDKKWKIANRDKIRAKDSNRRTRKTNAGGSFTANEWQALCNQYDNRCLKCGEVKPLTADHVMPVALGGTSDISNIQPLCKSCNSSKGATFKDYRNQPLLERWRTISIFDAIGG